ncbi:MAG: hypothetical protein GY853_00985 [PVC group bacterium]|nr:hypothetical protein [PVC group bacterium]
MSEKIEICWMCQHARWDDDLDLYDIRCLINQKIYDENSSCKYFDYNPYYSEINPRIEKVWDK